MANDVTLTGDIIKQRKIRTADRRASLSPAKQAELKKMLRKGLNVGSGPVIGPRPRGADVPSSFGQMRLWFVEQMALGTAVYNLPVVLQLIGELRPAALEQSMNEVVRRHEVLRTALVDRDGQLMQTVYPYSCFALPTVDLTGLPEVEGRGEAGRISQHHNQRPFDLSQPSMLRCTLLQTGTAEHTLLLALHHAAGDGWSLQTLTRELGTLYATFSSGGPSPLAELPIQYADYSNWQHQRLQGSVLNTLLDYWKKQLAGSPPLLLLPTDRKRPAVASFKGDIHQIVIPEALTNRLKEFCQKERITLFMALLAAFQILLARYSGQDDICVGTPVAGRPSAETEDLIGLFVNTVVIRTRFSGNPTVRQLLGSVRETLLEAQTHQELPFEKLVEVLRPERTLSHAPLFQAMLVLQNVPQSSMEAEGLRLNTAACPQGVEEFDLSLSIYDDVSSLRCSLSFSTDLFDRVTIERMLEHWRKVLEAMVAGPDTRLSLLPLLPSEERHKLLHAWNQTTVDYGQPCGIHRLFEQQAKASPESLAVDCGGAQLTYAQLDEHASQLACYLLKKGVAPQSLVGVSMERGVDLITAVLAILKAGAAYVPLDPKYPASRLNYMAQDAGLSILLTQSPLAAMWTSFAGSIIEVDKIQDELAQESTESPSSELNPEGLAYVMYTSGSTGTPKGVMVEHRHVYNQLMWAGNALGLGTKDSVLFKVSYGFDVSVLEVFLPLSRGARIVVAKPGSEHDVEYLVPLIVEKKVTYCNVSPTLLAAFVEHPDFGRMTSLRTVCCGTEVMKPELIDPFRKALPGTELWNCYGPTEATVQASFHVCRNSDANIPIGKPLANTQIYILDQEMQPVPVGLAGELFIGGALVARGYWNRPELTLQKFIPDPFSYKAGARLYRTGDWARWKPDGTLEFLGRRDNQIKLRGYRIELDEIEAELRQVAGVKEAAVLLKKNGQGRDSLVAYVVKDAQSDLTNLTLGRLLQGKLPEYMVPANYVFLDNFPLSANGKLDRLNLPEPEQNSAPDGHVSPGSIIEQLLAVIWNEVLGTEHISRNDNFFALGGHSLLAARVIARVRDRLKTELPVRSLFEAPVLADLAARVEEKMRAASGYSVPQLRPAPRNESAPASYAQQRLWFLNQLDPGSSAYNLSTVMQLDAGLNLATLEQAWSEIIRRHETLRTTFAKVKGQPVQVAQKYRTSALPLIDLSGLAEEKQIDEVKRLAQEDANKPFDLAAGPLLRTRVVKLDSRYILLVTMHHIISDAWSMGVLTQEAEALYTAFFAGQGTPLDELEIQYSDYAEWQREYLQKEYLEQELNYWKQELAGAPTVLELQTDRPRPAMRTQAGVQLPLEISQELARALREFGRREGATTFMTLMAAFQALLARYTGQDDILVGSPIAGRSHVELERLIGFFINMVVLRGSFGDQPTFRQLLKQVRETALGAFAHQDLPFEKLVEELQPERSIGRNPLFQVILAFQNVPRPALEMEGVALPAAGPGTAEMKFDLELFFWETNDRITGSLVYSPELFDRPTIERFIGHFSILLEQAMAAPDVPLSTLNVLADREFHQIVKEWNATSAEFPAACVHQLFEEQVEKNPDAVALVFDQRQMTYRELNGRANQLANHLRKHGIGTEVVAGVCLERGPELIVSLLAILKAGGAYVPLDPEYPIERLAYILEDAGVAVLLTQESCRAKLPALKAKPIFLDKDWETIAEESSAARACDVKSHNLAYMIYTSGSTGHPKGVMINHSSLVNLITWHNREYNVTAADKAIQLAGPAFDAATWEIWPYLVAGASLFLPRAKSYEIALELKKWLREREITICFLSTPLAEALVEDLPEDLPLRYMLTGGDRLHQVNKKLNFELVNHYGPTEITVLATSAKVDFKSPSPPIGRPITNAAVYILDKNRQPVPLGCTGEIYVGGVGVGRGYWQRPDLTAEYFLPDPFSAEPGARIYRTGDLGRYLCNGTIEYRGRVDHQVKIRGFRVELGEIESALKQEPAVREAIVLACQGPGGEKRLVAYVVTQGDAAVTSEKLKGQLKDRLPEYMVPTAFVFLKELPMTANGKVDAAKLPAPDLSQMRSEKAYVAPANQLQEQLVAIWEELLSARPIGIKDDFFELGGHSLLAVQLISRIEEKLNKRIPMASLFQGATIEHLAQVMGQEAGGQSWSPLVPIRPEGTRKPIYVVHAAGGHLMAYSDLARNWWEDQPLYGLQSRETNKELLPHTQVELMASEYVTAIRNFQPVGPYYVAGWSMGGVIAFEIARQLRQQGQELALLALMDPEAPAEKPTQYNWAVLLGSFATDLGMSMELLRTSWDEIAPLPPMQQLSRVWSLAKKEKLIQATMTLMTFRNLFDSFKTSAHTMRSYVGGVFDGRITLFRPENPIEYIGKETPENYYSDEPGKDWERLAARGVEVLTSPGQHYTMMQEPNVKVLATKLRACIDSAAKEF